MSFWNSPSELAPKQQHRWVVYLGDRSELSNANDKDKNTLPYYLAKSIEKPSYQIGTQEVKYLYSHTINFPKRLVWRPINITFYDVKITTSEKGFTVKPVVGDEKYLEQTSYMATRNNEITEKIYTSLTLTEEITQNSTQLFFYKLLQSSGYFGLYDLKPESSLSFKSYTFKKNIIKSLVGDNSMLKIIELDSDGKYLEIWNVYNPIVSDVRFDKLDYSSDSVLTITATISYDWAELAPIIEYGTQQETIRLIGESRSPVMATGIPEINYKE